MEHLIGFIILMAIAVIGTINKVKEDLNKKYGESKKLIWSEQKDDKNFEVEMRKGEWFITVITRPQKY